MKSQREEKQKGMISGQFFISKFLKRLEIKVFGKCLWTVVNYYTAKVILLGLCFDINL